MDNLRQQFEGYITDLFVQEDEALKNIQKVANENGLPTISVAPLDGKLLMWLAKLVGAKKIVEIGTLAGYSGVWLARGLSEGGKLYTLEKSAKHAEISRANFESAGVGEKVEVLQGEAQDIFKKVEKYAPFDLVFIDADKEGYPAYLKWAVDHLRPGGVIAAHNAFRNGNIMNPQDDGDRAMDAFNRALAGESRLESIILPLGDGMAVGIKL